MAGFERDHFRASRGGPERGRALGRALARPSASPSVGPPRRARKCENEKRKVHFTGRVPFAQHRKPFIFAHFVHFQLSLRNNKKPTIFEKIQEFESSSIKFSDQDVVNKYIRENS